PAGSRYEAADGLGAPPEGYRDIRTEAPPPVAAPSPSSASVSTASGGGGVAVALGPRRNAPVTILTGEAGAPLPPAPVLGLGRHGLGGRRGGGGPPPPPHRPRHHPRRRGRCTHPPPPRRRTRT